MDILEAIYKRHSVRNYTDKAISKDIERILSEEIEKCNNSSGLNIQLVLNEPTAFSGIMAKYGKFTGVMNYITLAGAKQEDLDEKIGYYGEKILLLSKTLGLDSCWVALTFSKGKCKSYINKGEKLACVIAIGYGETHGKERKSKAIDELCQINGGMPDWFKNGMEAAMLAPTAVNQQKFIFSLKDENMVSLRGTGGFYSKIDLGIVKYHFEIGAGIENFIWV